MFGVYQPEEIGCLAWSRARSSGARARRASGYATRPVDAVRASARQALGLPGQGSNERRMVAREGSAPPTSGCRPDVILFHHQATRRERREKPMARRRRTKDHRRPSKNDRRIGKQDKERQCRRQLALGDWRLAIGDWPSPLRRRNASADGTSGCTAALSRRFSPNSVRVHGSAPRTPCSIAAWNRVLELHRRLRLCRPPPVRPGQRDTRGRAGGSFRLRPRCSPPGRP